MCEQFKLTEIGLISGCSDKPKPSVPVKPPASRHKLVHCCANMAAGVLTPRQSQAQPRLMYALRDGKEWKKAKLRRSIIGRAPLDYRKRRVARRVNNMRRPSCQIVVAGGERGLSAHCQGRALTFTFSPTCSICSTTNFRTDPVQLSRSKNMDSLSTTGMNAFGNDPKMQIMRQVQQEAALQNARMLVEVYCFPKSYRHALIYLCSLLIIFPET